MSAYLCAHNFKISMMVRPYQIFLVFGLFFSALSIGLAQAVDVKYSDDAGNFNQVVSIDVTIDGFTNVRSFNFLTKWDPALLEFESISNKTTVLPNGEFVIAGPDVTGTPGKLTALLSQQGTTNYNLGPDDILFTINLTVVSALCTSTQVDTLYDFPRNGFFIFSGDSITSVRPGSIPGEVDLNPGCGASNVLEIGNAAGLPGTEVCIPIFAKNMTDLGGFNGLTFNWDPTILEYNRTENKISPEGEPLTNPANAATGSVEMIYSYTDFGGGGGLTTDSIALFCLCFDVIGDCDESTNMTLDETSTFLIVDSDGNPISHDLEDGTFEVNCCDATPNVVDVSCFGGDDGSITLTPAGCQNITNIAWSNTNQTGTQITDLEAGAYDATITYDGGTSMRVIPGIMVNQPTQIDVTNVVFTKDVDGDDGGVDITVEGGVMPYSYLWSNGAVTQDISNVPANSYSVTITDDNLCQVNFGPYVVATAPNISGTITNVQCFGTATGAVDIEVSGGASPYTYDWSCAGAVDANGNISGLTGGSCTVTVTDDNDCASTMTFNIGAPSSALTGSIGQVIDDVSNDGNGSISLNVNGGWGNYSYEWSDGTSTTYPNSNPLTNLFGGNYSVTISDDEGCEIVLNDIVVEGLRVFAMSIDPVVCFGDNNGAINIDVLGGSGTFTYDWSCTNGTVDQNGNISGLTSGPCTVTVTDMVENNSTTATFTVPGPTEALDVFVDVTCANNGNDGALSASVSGGVPPYSYSWNTNPVQTTEAINNLSTGDYTVLVTDSVGCVVMGFGNVNNCAEADCYRGMDVITPNEDGKNDFFVIDCADMSQNKLRIFTRWGQEVITFDDYRGEWNGLDEGGNLVDEDTYMWVLEVYPSNGNTALYKGAVSVIYNLR